MLTIYPRKDSSGGSMRGWLLAATRSSLPFAFIRAHSRLNAGGRGLGRTLLQGFALLLASVLPWPNFLDSCANSQPQSAFIRADPRLFFFPFQQCFYQSRLAGSVVRFWVAARLRRVSVVRL